MTLENRQARNRQTRRRTEEHTSVLQAAGLQWERNVACARRALMKLDGDEFITALWRYLLMFSSEKRAGEMLSLLERASPETFWKSFFYGVDYLRPNLGIYAQLAMPA
jgi:hypothetical protein